jgi:hypothetical protein
VSVLVQPTGQVKGNTLMSLNDWSVIFYPILSKGFEDFGFIALTILRADLEISKT